MGWAKGPELDLARARCHALLLEGMQARSYLEKAITSKPELWGKVRTDHPFLALEEQDPEFQAFFGKLRMELN